MSQIEVVEVRRDLPALFRDLRSGPATNQLFVWRLSPTLALQNELSALSNTVSNTPPSFGSTYVRYRHSSRWLAGREDLDPSNSAPEHPKPRRRSAQLRQDRFDLVQDLLNNYALPYDSNV